jgi:hypothetical protein
VTSGVAEVDETFVGGKVKSKHIDKRGGDARRAGKKRPSLRTPFAASGE